MSGVQGMLEFCQGCPAGWKRTGHTLAELPARPGMSEDNIRSVMSSYDTARLLAPKAVERGVFSPQVKLRFGMLPCMLLRPIVRGTAGRPRGWGA